MLEESALGDKDPGAGVADHVRGLPSGVRE